MAEEQRKIEQILCQRWVEGNDSVFEQLWQPIVPVIRGYLQRLRKAYWPTANDSDLDNVVSETVIVVLSKRYKIELDRSASFSTICCGYARICFFRARDARPKEVLNPSGDVELSIKESPILYDDCNFNEELHHSLMLLSTASRKVLCLRLGLDCTEEGVVATDQSLTTKEVAERLNKKDDWVRRNFREAKEQLTQRLDKFLDI